jgi:hypothetical protein
MAAAGLEVVAGVMLTPAVGAGPYSRVILMAAVALESVAGGMMTPAVGAGSSWGAIEGVRFTRVSENVTCDGDGSP